MGFENLCYGANSLISTEGNLVQSPERVYSVNSNGNLRIGASVIPSDDYKIVYRLPLRSIFNSCNEGCSGMINISFSYLSGTPLMFGLSDGTKAITCASSSLSNSASNSSLMMGYDIGDTLVNIGDVPDARNRTGLLPGSYVPPESTMLGFSLQKMGDCSPDIYLSNRFDGFTSSWSLDDFGLHPSSSLDVVIASNNWRDSLLFYYLCVAVNTTATAVAGVSYDPASEYCGLTPPSTQPSSMPSQPSHTPTHTPSLFFSPSHDGLVTEYTLAGFGVCGAIFFLALIWKNLFPEYHTDREAYIRMADEHIRSFGKKIIFYRSAVEKPAWYFQWLKQLWHDHPVVRLTCWKGVSGREPTIVKLTLVMVDILSLLTATCLCFFIFSPDFGFCESLHGSKDKFDCEHTRNMIYVGPTTSICHWVEEDYQCRYRTPMMQTYEENFNEGDHYMVLLLYAAVVICVSRPFNHILSYLIREKVCNTILQQSLNYGIPSWLIVDFPSMVGPKLRAFFSSSLGKVGIDGDGHKQMVASQELSAEAEQMDYLMLHDAADEHAELGLTSKQENMNKAKLDKQHKDREKLEVSKTLRRGQSINHDDLASGDGFNDDAQMKGYVPYSRPFLKRLNDLMKPTGLLPDMESRPNSLQEEFDCLLYSARGILLRPRLTEESSKSVYYLQHMLGLDDLGRFHSRALPSLWSERLVRWFPVLKGWRKRYRNYWFSHQMQLQHRKKQELKEQARHNRACSRAMKENIIFSRQDSRRIFLRLRGLPTRCKNIMLMENFLLSQYPVTARAYGTGSRSMGLDSKPFILRTPMAYLFWVIVTITVAFAYLAGVLLYAHVVYSSATHDFFLILLSAYGLLQLVVYPVYIYVYGIVVSDAIAKELNYLHIQIRNRAKTAFQRKNGVFGRDQRGNCCVTEYYNGASRVAKSQPKLVMYRLILELNDYDIVRNLFYVMHGYRASTSMTSASPLKLLKSGVVDVISKQRGFSTKGIANLTGDKKVDSHAAASVIAYIKHKSNHLTANLSPKKPRTVTDVQDVVSLDSQNHRDLNVEDGGANIENNEEFPSLSQPEERDNKFSCTDWTQKVCGRMMDGISDGYHSILVSTGFREDEISHAHNVKDYDNLVLSQKIKKQIRGEDRKVDSLVLGEGNIEWDSTSDEYKYYSNYFDAMLHRYQHAAALLLGRHTLSLPVIVQECCSECAVVITLTMVGIVELLAFYHTEWVPAALFILAVVVFLILRAEHRRIKFNQHEDVRANRKTLHLDIPLKMREYIAKLENLQGHQMEEKLSRDLERDHAYEKANKVNTVNKESSLNVVLPTSPKKSPYSLTESRQAQHALLSNFDFENEDNKGMDEIIKVIHSLKSEPSKVSTPLPSLLPPLKVKGKRPLLHAPSAPPQRIVPVDSLGASGQPPPAIASTPVTPLSALPDADPFPDPFSPSLTVHSTPVPADTDTPSMSNHALFAKSGTSSVKLVKAQTDFEAHFTSDFPTVPDHHEEDVIPSKPAGAGSTVKPLFGREVNTGKFSQGLPREELSYHTMFLRSKAEIEADHYLELMKQMKNEKR